MRLIWPGSGLFVLLVLTWIWLAAPSPDVPTVLTLVSDVDDGQDRSGAVTENPATSASAPAIPARATETVPVPSAVEPVVEPENTTPAAILAAVPVESPVKVAAEPAAGTNGKTVQVDQHEITGLLSHLERLQALNPVHFAACDACLAQLAEALVYADLTEATFSVLLDWLAQSGEPRLAGLLWTVLTELELQSGYGVRADQVLAAMGAIESVPAALMVVRQWLDWSSLRVSTDTEDVFAVSVRETLAGLLLQLQDRPVLGQQLFVLYRELAPDQARQLLQTGQPVLLLQAGFQYLEQGDVMGFEQLLQQLPDMSVAEMPGVLLGLERRLQRYGMATAVLQKVAVRWVGQQAGDEDMSELLDDWIAHGELTRAERQFLGTMLAASRQ